MAYHPNLLRTVPTQHSSLRSLRYHRDDLFETETYLLGNEKGGGGEAAPAERAEDIRVALPSSVVTTNSMIRDAGLPQPVRRNGKYDAMGSDGDWECSSSDGLWPELWVEAEEGRLIVLNATSALPAGILLAKVVL